MSDISISKVLVTIFGVCFLTLVVACVLWWPEIKRGIHSATSDAETAPSKREDKSQDQSASATVQAKTLAPEDKKEPPATRSVGTAETPVQSTQPTVNPPPTPVWRILTKQSFVVLAHDHYRVPIFVSADDEIARVKGTYLTESGIRYAITAYLVDNEGYDNFSHNARFMSYWSSSGEMNSASFDVRLKSGSYYLVFDNRTSIVTSKDVMMQVTLLPRQ